MNKKLISFPEFWKIQELKNKLEATDYKALKYAEGLITATEYKPIKEARQAIRDEINRLEAVIESKLKG